LIHVENGGKVEIILPIFESSIDVKPDIMQVYNIILGQNVKFLMALECGKDLKQYITYLRLIDVREDRILHI